MALLLVCALLFTLRAARLGGFSRFAAAGAFSALAILTRSEGLILAPFLVAAGLPRAQRGETRRAVLESAAALAALAIVLAPLACSLPPAATQAPEGGVESPSVAPTEAPITDATIAVTGPMEVVYDWSTDRCDYNDRPDMPLRPFRGADGIVRANRSWPSNRLFAGPDLDSVAAECDVVLLSSLDPDPAHHNREEWFQALYTEDGQTIHAIVHNEHNERGTSYWSMTYAQSTDGGRTFTQPESPAHFVAGSPYRFQPDSGLYGLLQGSNIVKGPDGAYYMLVANRTYDQQSYTCLFRTEELSDPGAWRAWNGSDFGWQPVDPYLEQVASPSARDCAPIDSDYLGGIGIGESLIYSTYLNRYVSLNLGHFQHGARVSWGVVYSTSEDLIHWENKKFLQETVNGAETGSGGPDGIGYLILLDPDSDSRNFETAGKDAYVYFTRFNHSTAMVWPDSDLMRYPIEFFPDEAAALQADVRTLLTARRTSGSDTGVVGFTGTLTRLDGRPLPGKPIEVTAMPDDDQGIPYEYTYTGIVPDDATRGNGGFRVNAECNCSGASEFFIYEISYSENGGPNLVQGNRFQRGAETFIKWGSGQVTLEASDLDEGRMLHVKAQAGQDIFVNTWDFTVTPGASFTYTVKARVVPSSYRTGFFGLFMTPYDAGLRVTIPFFKPPIPVGQAVTDADGNFEVTWQNAPSGRYEIQASYPGSGEDWGSSVVFKSIVR
jgi:hypothetical protein